MASPARPEAHLCVANAASPPHTASPASSAKAGQATQPGQRAHPGHPTHTAQAARPAQTKRSAKPCAATWFNAVHTDRLRPAHHLCNTPFLSNAPSHALMAKLFACLLHRRLSTCRHCVRRKHFRAPTKIGRAKPRSRTWKNGKKLSQNFFGSDFFFV